MRYLAILATLIVVAAVTLATQDFPLNVEAAGTQYYVDSVAGSDSNNGTSSGSPWKSLAPVKSRTFVAGDTINLKAGSSFSGGLTFKSSGTASAPITIQAYGEGARPVISNTASMADTIRLDANYVTIRGLLIKDGQYCGVRVSDGFHHATVENNEIANVGLGLMLQGDSVRVIGNYIHDLRMVKNTSTSSTDDYGANGVMIDNSSGHEIGYNRFVNNRAPSIDYGYDGGAVELWGTISNINIHDNYSQGAQGFLEQGGGDVSNISLVRNESRNDYAAFVMLHLDPNHVHGGTASNFVMDANTIVRSITPKGYRVLDIQGTPTSSQVVFKNNLVYSNMSIARDGDQGHIGNKYFLVDGATLGFSLGSGESQQSGSGIDLSNFKYSNYFGGTTTTAPAPAPTAAPTSAPAPSPTTAPTSPTPVPTIAPAAPTPAPTNVPVAPSPTSAPAPSPTAVPSTGGEILVNGDFEKGSANWYLRSEGSATVSVQSAARQGGSAGLQFKGNGSEPLARQDLAIKGGQAIQVSGWANVPTFNSGMNVTVELKAYDSAGNQVQYWRLKEYSSKTSGWVNFKNTVTMPANATKVRLQIRAPKLNGTAYFDTLSIR